MQRNLKLLIATSLSLSINKLNALTSLLKTTAFKKAIRDFKGLIEILAYCNI